MSSRLRQQRSAGGSEGGLALALAAQHRLVLWSAQVDDVAATVLGDDGAAVCNQSVAVHEDIQRQRDEGCGLPLAPAKRTMVATDPVVAEEIAARLGPGAEVGTWCMRLGVDYALWNASRGGST